MTSLRPLLFASLLATALGAAPAAARADDDLASYALVVGSNAPGPGQTELAFAEDDAREVAGVLRDLGGYPATHVTTLLHPSPARLLEAVSALQRDAASETAAGRRVRVFFYYSGHAKASGLSLGQAELPLAELRTRLLAVPSTLTLVVLDACQSGAFSRIKGAEAAADFSYNSRTRLDASGVAVLASSTGSELSQESDFLRSSYFTHNLLVGLRGAADDNHDGRVSLDEAYRYTYHQTLLETGATAIGGQHVSVEVDLKGQGEIPLSYPERATATLVLPAAAAGHVLVARAPAHAVVAELQKVAGAPVDVAVAAGRYEVLIRTDDRLYRCDATASDAAPSTVELDRCAHEQLSDGTGKGGGGAGDDGPRWHVALTTSIAGLRHDGYTDRLVDFGYHEQGVGLEPALSGHLLRRIHPHFLVGGEAGIVDNNEWFRDSMTFKFFTASAGAVGRAETGDRWIAWAELSAGLALSQSTFVDVDGNRKVERFPGPYLGAAIGTDVQVTDHVGLSARLSTSYAPTLDNLIGDQHDAGATSLGLGMVYRQ
ncbi:MAG TPA: caspase family protein [Kofleriaceae bacterium]|nr:caspase family protein [Kofleriaceae bacterium]